MILFFEVFVVPVGRSISTLDNKCVIIYCLCIPDQGYSQPLNGGVLHACALFSKKAGLDSNRTIMLIAEALELCLWSSILEVLIAEALELCLWSSILEV